MQRSLFLPVEKPCEEIKLGCRSKKHLHSPGGWIKMCSVLMVVCDEVAVREISKVRFWHTGANMDKVRTCENPFSWLCFHIHVSFVDLYSSSWGGGSWRWLLSSALYWQCCLLTQVIWSINTQTYFSNMKPWLVVVLSTKRSVTGKDSQFYNTATLVSTYSYYWSVFGNRC